MSLNQVGVPDTDDQAALVDAVAGALARASATTELLDPARRELPDPRPVWSAMAEVGIAGLPVPESLGGSGGSWADLSVAGELLGAAVALSLVSSTPTGVPVLAASVVAVGMGLLGRDATGGPEAGPDPLGEAGSR